MKSEELARKIRIHAIKMVSHAHASHIGGILSCADIIAVLYNNIAKVYPNDPKNENRDRIILSKGHNGVAIYAVLAEMGFYSTDVLDTYGDNGGIFSSHISHKLVPGVELSTGSLGQGVCAACGMALNGKIRNKDYHVYAIVGDGECNEGSVWEIAMFSAQYKLDNFTVIIDRNKMQAMGNCNEVMDMEPLDKKWESFGWNVIMVADGNNHHALKEAFNKPIVEGKPTVIIANTVKGKGVSFMENSLLWHYRDPQGGDLKNALAELEENL
ncbi:transketolase [Veillonella sp. R32]|uniref:transketolase n=1 Tax=Veillonella sp. R32 TaxID=2021312 RepID=UPI001389B2D8|nr:transketolase [Veillonella sp. R32]KAF1680110.1 transketolase [Veillonella sp. R32]